MELKDKLMTLEDFKAVRDVDVASNSAQFTEIKADLDAVGTVSEIGRDEFTEIAWLISKQNKWDHSAAAQTSVKGLLDISRCEKLTITPNGGVYAFLNTYSPVKDATPDYSESYNARIVPSDNTPVDYFVESDMHYLYTVMKNSSGDDVFPLVENHRSIKTDNTLTEEYTPAEARAVGDALSLKLDVSEFDNPSVKELSYTLTSGKFIRFNDGNTSNSAARAATSYIPVSSFKKISYDRILSTATEGVMGMAWYDSEKVYIDGIRMVWGASEAGYRRETVDVPQNAAYARFTTFADTETYGVFSVTGMNAILAEFSDISDRIDDVDSETKNIRNTLLSGGVHTYVDFKNGYINTSGTQINITSVTPDANFKHIIIPCAEGDAFHFDVLGGGSTRLRWAFCDVNGNVLYKSATMSESSSATPLLYNNTGVYIAPPNSAYVICNHHIMDAGFTPKVYKCYPNSMLNHIASLNGEFPYMPLENWRRQVIATYESYIAIKDGNSIRISADCGDTWTENIDASDIDDIKNAHFFANGTLAIFTELDAYYVENMIVNQASVYEADGITPFEADEDRNFNALRDHAERKFINGNDMYVFNNYHKIAGTGRPIVWYSIDNGHTYKIAVEFNIENMPSVRHFHDVIYWEQHDVFILATGDTNASECYVCALSYDSSNDSWDMQILAGSSRDYKWCGLSIWNNEIYYCYDSTPGAVWKCSYDDIADKSKHVCILDYTESDCLHNAFGKNGDMVVTMSTSRSTAGNTVEIPFTAEECVRKIRYSTNRKDFQEIFLPNQLLNYVSSIGRPKPVTSDGHIYFSSTSGVDGLPSIPIDDYVRIFLNKNAFGARV